MVVKYESIRLNDINNKPTNLYLHVGKINRKSVTCVITCRETETEVDFDSKVPIIDNRIRFRNHFNYIIINKLKKITKEKKWKD